MKTQDHIQKAIQAYYGERATRGDLAELEAWLREDDAHVRIFAEHGMIEWQMLCEHQKQDAAAILATLRDAEENAEACLVQIHHFPDLEEGSSDPTDRGIRSTISNYLNSDLLRSRMVAIQAIAAVILLGLLLTIVFLGPSPSPQQAEVQSDSSIDTQIDSVPIVATLTAEYGAQWTRRPGQDLYAGQRFELTEGVAEITTIYGAVAVLQAPATVELLNHPNSLRLHSGKLVGTCETDASKGFVVRTSYLDVTDLGTRFGVDADTHKTQVHVFEGAVTAIRPDASAGSKPALVVTGESAITSIDTDAIVHTKLSTDRFAALQPAPIQLPGTAEGLAAGLPDPNWLVMSANGKPLDQPVQMAATAHNAYAMSRDISDESLGGWWLQYYPDQRPTLEQPKVAHRIETGFDLGTDLDPATTRLVIACAVDDSLKAIYVNGNRTTDFGTFVGRVYHFTIDQHLRSGRNTIVFEVENKWNDPNPNPIGLFVRWHLLPDVAH